MLLSMCAANWSLDLGGGGFTEAGAKICVQFGARRAMCALPEGFLKARQNASARRWRSEDVGGICEVVRRLIREVRVFRS